MRQATTVCGKRKIAFLLFMAFISGGLFSQTLGNNNRLGTIVYNAALGKQIVLVSQIDNYVLYSDTDAFNLCLFDEDAKTNREIKISENNFLSARLVNYMDTIIVEVTGMTNAGNGNLYLLDTDLNTLLETHYVDWHMDYRGYFAFVELEQFSNREYTGAEEISRIFRGGTLNIDYNYNGENIIRIYGTADYVLQIFPSEEEEIILSEEIDEMYVYTREDNKFVLTVNDDE